MGKLYQIGVVVSVGADSYKEAIEVVGDLVKDDMITVLMKEGLPIKDIRVENELPPNGHAGDGEASFHTDDKFHGEYRVIYMHPENEPLEQNEHNAPLE